MKLFKLLLLLFIFVFDGDCIGLCSKLPTGIGPFFYNAITALGNNLFDMVTRILFTFCAFEAGECTFF